MKYDSLFSRNELYVAAACVGAHSSGGEGFRQRDVRFFIDLLINWCEASFKIGDIDIQNTQVLRYMEYLTKEGYARKLSRKQAPLYRLTRTGLLELVSRIVSNPQVGNPGRFFFVYFFIHSYGPRIRELIKLEGQQFPTALQIELDQLLDFSRYQQREIDETRQAIKRLESRIDSGYACSSIVKKLTKEGKSFGEIVKVIEREHPYELNSQKPLSELINSLPKSMQQWELEVGAPERAKYLWEPEREILRGYLKQIENIK